MEPTHVTALATAARDAASAGAGAVEAWRGEQRERPRWELEAAYACARRLDQDRAWARAADLLEVAIAERRRDPYGPPRFWHRAELTFVPMLALVGVQVVVAIDQGVWYRVPMSLLYLGIPLSHMYAARREDAVIPQVPDSVGTLPARTSRLVRTVAAATRSGRGDDEIVAELVATAEGERADTAVDRRLAPLAVAQAQRQVALSPMPGRARRVRLLDRARSRLLESLSG